MCPIARETFYVCGVHTLQSKREGAFGKHQPVEGVCGCQVRSMPGPTGLAAVMVAQDNVIAVSTREDLKVLMMH